MHLRQRLRNLSLACERGFTTVTLMGVLAIGGLLVAASFAAVDPDISLSREDQDYKQAYGAAESGLQWYLNSLSKDNDYYIKCTNVPEPSPGEPAPVNQQWDGASPRIWRNIPGEEAAYTVELLPAPGYAECDPSTQYSMVDSFGNMRIRVTGRSRGELRSVIATLRRRNFIDFIYFTDFETLDPAAYSNPAWMTPRCSRYREDRAGMGCTEIRFADGDDVLGPFHTNDNVLICGSPQFGRTARDVIEVNGPVEDGPFQEDCAGSEADVQGHLDHPAGPLGMPPSNTDLKTIAETDYRFSGFTVIELDGANMHVTNAARWPDGLPHTLSLPANGVVYVESSAALGGCTAGFDRTQAYDAQQPGCGDVWIKGAYGDDLTVAADNDIVINGNIARSEDNQLLGLIANNFVRVYHPVYADDSCTGNDPDYLHDVTIQAAILALNHSFVVDNWACGQPAGTLHVEGAIAQKFRGPVGTGSSSAIATGYIKDYVYNDRLRYREPPYFLDPVQASWRIARQNEQIPATGAE